MAKRGSGYCTGLTSPCTSAIYSCPDDEFCCSVGYNFLINYFVWVYQSVPTFGNPRMGESNRNNSNPWQLEHNNYTELGNRTVVCPDFVTSRIPLSILVGSIPSRY